MKYSLRNFLLLSILLTMLVMGGVTIFSSYRASVHEVEELFDAQLSRSARLMLGVVLAEKSLGTVEAFYDSVEANDLKLSDKQQLIEEEIYRQGHLYELKLAYQVWDSYGNLILRSANAPIRPMSDLQPGYTSREINGEQWRTFSVWDSNLDFQVITAERGDVRSELVDKITLQLTLPFVLLVPLMAAVVWYFIGYGLRPLERVAAEIGHRQDAHMGNRMGDRLQPLQVETVPTEIQPLVDELNRLFDSLRSSFEKERNFTSDAAHELRTPLAALKTHLEVLQSTTDDVIRQKALASISQGVERAGHLVEQLLGLARLDPEAIRETQQPEALDLQALCVEVMADIYPLSNEKQQQISLQSDEGLMMKGYRFALESMLRNLLENSIRYTPEGGEIKLILCKSGMGLEIQLHDSGPGIPQDQREQVLGRFRKVSGQASRHGSGIGLSIVKRVAELHQMQLALLQSTELGGLCVRLSMDDTGTESA